MEDGMVMVRPAGSSRGNRALTGELLQRHLSHLRYTREAILEDIVEYDGTTPIGGAFEGLHSYPSIRLHHLQGSSVPLRQRQPTAEVFLFLPECLRVRAVLSSGGVRAV